MPSVFPESFFLAIISGNSKIATTGVNPSSLSICTIELKLVVVPSELEVIPTTSVASAAVSVFSVVDSFYFYLNGRMFKFVLWAYHKQLLSE